MKPRVVFGDFEFISSHFVSFPVAVSLACSLPSEAILALDPRRVWPRPVSLMSLRFLPVRTDVPRCKWCNLETRLLCESCGDPICTTASPTAPLDPLSTFHDINGLCPLCAFVGEDSTAAECTVRQRCIDLDDEQVEDAEVVTQAESDIVASGDAATVDADEIDDRDVLRREARYNASVISGFIKDHVSFLLEGRRRERRRQPNEDVPIAPVVVCLDPSGSDTSVLSDEDLALIDACLAVESQLAASPVALPAPDCPVDTSASDAATSSDTDAIFMGACLAAESQIATTQPQPSSQPVLHTSAVEEDCTPQLGGLISQ